VPEKSISSSSSTDPLAFFRDLLAPDQISELEDILSCPLPSAIRINSLKNVPKNAIHDLAGRYSWQVKPVPFCPSGWQVRDARLSQTIEYKLGNYYIQEAASMLPVELFGFKDQSPLILDLAAAPGGKTTHLIDRTNDLGLVLANDTSASRLSGLRAVLQSWGTTHSAITHYPGELFGAWFPNTFDYVLLDAPCSMENLHTEEDHPRRVVTPHERVSLARRQLSLLTSALCAVRPGGQIVYSTCTLAPEEDEGVLDGLLIDFPHLVSIEDVTQHLGRPAPALRTYQNQTFDPEVSNAVRLWPHIFGTSGFFAALLTKKDETKSKLLPPPQRPFSQSGLFKLSKIEQNQLIRYFSDTYGFDLAVFLETQDLSLWNRGNLIFGIPNLYFQSFERLPFFHLGLLIAEMTPKGYSPSAEFAARFGTAFTQGTYLLSEEWFQPWFEGQDVPASQSSGNLPPGTTVVVLDHHGRNLGRGRLHPDRLKNLRKRL
jgi:16S rRNA (cytosine1407-C5)-methyltransferase